MKNTNIFTSALITAKDHTTNTTVKIGTILEDSATGAEFILLNHLVDLKDFINPHRTDNGFIKANIVVKGDFNE